MASWIKRFFGGSKHGHRHRRAETKASQFIPATLPPRRDGKKVNPAEIYADFRLRALTHSRTTLGIPEPPADAPAWGLLMESATPNGITSLLALADGTTGICNSVDGSIIAGENHEAFKKVALGFIRLAGRSLPLMIGTEEFPSPGSGRTIFYVFTDYGVFTAGAGQTVLAGGQSSLSPLFYAGQVVITQLRSGPAPSPPAMTDIQIRAAKPPKLFSTTPTRFPSIGKTVNEHTVFSCVPAGQISQSSV